jgi:hypothetical protein
MLDRRIADRNGPSFPKQSVMIKPNLLIALAGTWLTFSGCQKHDPVAAAPSFVGKELVVVSGYSADIMEPFISHDGNVLLFNNSNDPAVNTNLHWATRTDDTHFIYQGEITGANTASLDAVASLDRNGQLYFVSTRTYFTDLNSLYRGNFSGGVVDQVAAVTGPSKNQAGWLNFDAAIDAAGDMLYFVDGRFDANGGPYEADIAIAGKINSNFNRLANSSDLLKNVNTLALEYAPCISENSLELYFTRTDAPLVPTSITQIYVAVRNNSNEPFGTPVKLTALTGFVEAPTLSSDGNILYFHQREATGKFALYLTRRMH